MNPAVNTIANRLSLRPPQRTSLEILARICDIISLEKGADVSVALKAVESEFSTVTDFERDFPSLCFALATGVGKTRLMGAFIAYLNKTEGIRHFFVLAPNLTIYNKLIADFTPNTPKYVFQGIAEFAVEPPEIITGDNYESGRGVRTHTLFGEDTHVHVNIFNIGKITSIETPKGAVKTNVPKFRRLQEYVGQSYFDYLSKLDDLVLLMDESHRYRASAGMKAINELKPILGLELTATPQIERGGGADPFKNVIYSYPLSNAMEDGFVKEPAVATRENFDIRNYDEGGLERLKLEDGVHIHENTKVELEVYARENSLPIVKPFMLVIARDTDHANALVRLIEDATFFEGRYKGKIITVHSALKGEERDETVAQLIHVERSDNPTEIVVHVNMLKEGWDVTNLYTIVPLRAGNSRTLVEQSIGRGLRLPYGKRTGVGSVDRLTIVSHDKFQEIVDYANSPESIIRGGLRIVGIPTERTRVVVVEPEIINRLVGTTVPPGQLGTFGEQQRILFESPRAQEAAKATLEVIREFERLPRSADLAKPEIRRQIAEKVTTLLTPVQGEIEGMVERVDVDKIVAETIQLRNELSIDIPRITVQPVGDVTRGYREFRMDLSRVNYQPVDNEILIQELHRREQYRLMSGTGIVPEEKLEDYLVRGLIDFDDISYDDQAELLYNLAAQVVTHLRSYLKDENEVRNVLQYHQQGLVNLIHVQMQEHFEEKATAFEVHVSKGFTTLRPNHYSAPADEIERDFRVPVVAKQEIRRMLFSGFRKCLYRVQKFDSDSERRFAAVLENDVEVLKWFKPAKGDFQIHFASDASYEPDFVVETRKEKFLCEPKSVVEMEDRDVLAKARAAAEWCRHAKAHEEKNAGKPWTYLLIPHDVITDNKTIQGLAATYAFQAGSAKIGNGEPRRREAAPFAWVTPLDAEKYRTCVPLLTLKAAAGAFSDPQHVEDDGWEWISVDTKHHLRPGMFVAQVVGKSMEPAIPDGAYCLFAAPVTGSRQGKTVLVQLRDATDPETGERYTVKLYESEKTKDGDSWRHAKITLKPNNPEYAPIKFTSTDEGRIQVVAEMIEVLGAA